MLDREQSPHQKPNKCRRTKSRASAFVIVVTSCADTLPESKTRYGNENGKNRVASAHGNSSPELSVRPSTTAIGSTLGAPNCLSSLSILYSRLANSATVSLIAYTSASGSSVARTKRTMCREIPRFSASSGSSGQFSKLICHGKPVTAAISSPSPVIRSAMLAFSHIEPLGLLSALE